MENTLKWFLKYILEVYCHEQVFLRQKVDFERNVNKLLIIFSKKISIVFNWQNIDLKFMDYLRKKSLKLFWCSSKWLIELSRLSFYRAINTSQYFKRFYWFFTNFDFLNVKVYPFWKELIFCFIVQSPSKFNFKFNLLNYNYSWCVPKLYWKTFCCNEFILCMCLGTTIASLNKLLYAYVYWIVWYPLFAHILWKIYAKTQMRQLL